METEVIEQKTDRKIMAEQLATLFKKDSKGNLQFWEIGVVYNFNDTADITTSYGRVEGKSQKSTETISEGKNTGKANATTACEQALAEARSRWTKQQERKGYVDSVEKTDVDQRPGAEPMLAHRFDKYPEKVTYPCAIQPKLDGHRCIAVYENGVTKLFSRQRKPIIGLPHIEKAINTLLAGRKDQLILDGELYNHDYKDNFEKLTSHIRSATPKDGYEIVQYHMYDIVVADMPFQKRTGALQGLLTQSDSPHLVLVETGAATEGSVFTVFKRHRAAGYEGSILRNYTGLYVGKRSYDLQKVKEFLDAEFKIVGVEEGRGKMKGHAIFVCHTHEGKEFKAKMKGSLDLLAGYFQNAEKYIGKTITVQFQEYTKDGIPRFPVAIRFREDGTTWNNAFQKKANRGD